MNAFLLTLGVLTQLLYLQQNHQIDSVKRIIQDIKLDERFIYGEFSHEEKTIAYENAINDFMTSANILRSERGLALINHDSIRDSITSLSYVRGDMNYYFVYMACSDILSITNLLIQNDIPTETQDMDLRQLDGFSIEGATKEVLYGIIDREMIENVWGYLTNQKKIGHVSDFDKAHDFNEIPGSAYLVVFDRNFRVAAILSPPNNDARINIRNNKPESVSQYRGHGVVWFKL